MNVLQEKNKTSASRDLLGKLRALFEKLYTYSLKRPELFLLMLSAVFVFVMESLCRHSVIQGFLYPFKQPGFFLLNVLVMFALLSISKLFRKDLVVLFLISVLILVLGVCNSVILTYRPMPMTFIDILLLQNVISIMNVYLTKFQIVLVIIAVIAGLAFFTLLFLKCKKRPRSFIRALLVFFAAVLLAFSAASLFGISSDYYEKTPLPETVSKYGFVYTFVNSVFDRGIDKPETYTSSDIDKITEGIDKNSHIGSEGLALTEDGVNIIYVQLESFFDVNHLDGVTYSENPVPNFTALKEKYPSGFLSVPSVGAGTANTEFEVLTCMNIDFFGIGEYPYKTILQESAAESICCDLDKLGYSSHAIHNNSTTFYGRDTVFPALGFDTYTGMEYIQNIEYNPIGWAKDKVITDVVMDCLESTKERDFVFAITVQGHGKYQNGAGLPENDIEAYGIKDEDFESAFEYYLAQLRETDLFIGELIEAVSSIDEKTAIVFYGDHLPNFDIDESDIENHDLYQSEYVVWTNFDVETQDRDLEAYQLSSHVLELLEIPGGIMNQFHREYYQSEGYIENMELLQYDMLFGEYYIYGGENPYEKTDMQLGVNPITIESAKLNDDELTLYGKGFTAWSRICVDGENLSTQLNADGSLTAEYSDDLSGAVITIRQINDEFFTLSGSKPYIFRGGTK